MGNQSGPPEKVVAFRQPEMKEGSLIAPAGGEITNFRQPVAKPATSAVINLTSISGTTGLQVVEELHPGEDTTGVGGPSKAQILDMALHRLPEAKKAA